MIDLELCRVHRSEAEARANSEALEACCLSTQGRRQTCLGLAEEQRTAKSAPFFSKMVFAKTLELVCDCSSCPTRSSPKAQNFSRLAHGIPKDNGPRSVAGDIHGHRPRFEIAELLFALEMPDCCSMGTQGLRGASFTRTRVGDSICRVSIIELSCSF